MAASDAIPVPRKNVAFRFPLAFRKPADSTLITTWTGADSEVSLDGAAYADCTNEAAEIGTSGTGYIDLTAAEMNADMVWLKITITNSGSVTYVFAIYPESAGDYRVADTQKVDVETIKTQALTAAAGITFPSSIASPTNITAATGVVLSAVTHTGAVIPTVSTLTGHTPQTGDSFARIGANGAGLTSLAPAATALSTATWTGTLAINLGTTNTTVATNLDATITSRLASASYSAPPSASTISAQVASDLATAHGAGSWATATGFSTHSAFDVWAVGTRTITGGSLTTAPPTAAAIADAVWDEARTGHTTAGTFGFYLDAAISGISGGGGSGATAQQVWEYATRSLTEAVELDSAVETKITNIENASGYMLAVLAGACADPQTASETYAITVFGSTFTVDMAGQTSTGTRTAPTLTKT